ncbi:MAG: hypothetical protein K0S15_1729 [Solirubrobacterales bacterium]|jgi:hypothetical protein|nr:hypothetical protein [Solirubrobacterales bacterium]
MDEAAKDRVTALIHDQIDRLERGDPELWREGTPEEKVAAELDELSLEEKHFASVLLDRLIADEDEQESDPGLQRIEADAA